MCVGEGRGRNGGPLEEVGGKNERGNKTGISLLSLHVTGKNWGAFTKSA